MRGHVNEVMSRNLKGQRFKKKQKTEQIIRKMVRMNESDSFVYVFLSLVDMATFFTS